MYIESYPLKIEDNAIIKQFNEQSMLTKKDIIESIELNLEHYKEEAKADKEHSASYYNLLIKLLEKFHYHMERIVLFDKLEKLWRYYYLIDDNGIILYLEHCKIKNNDKEKFIIADELFELHKCETRMLSVEDYSKIYGVENVTVRQWIYRGKLKNAKKLGGEWFIPELNECPKRGYIMGVYYWDKNVTNFKKGFEEYQSYDEAVIVQCSDNKNKYRITLFSNNGFEKAIDCDKKEKEKIELMLIENPNVKYNTRAQIIYKNAKYNNENFPKRKEEDYLYEK